MSKNTQYLSVVQGNDFTLNINVSKYNADNSAYTPYDLSDCSQVVCFLVAITGGRRYKLPITINGNVLTTEVDGSMLNVGVLGIELLFEDAENHSKRSYEPALIKIVRSNAEATFTQADFDSNDDCRLHMTIGVNSSFITVGAPTADTEIDATSYNAVSNAAVTEAINNLQTQIDTIGSEILDPASVYTKDETEALIDTMVDPQEMADYVSNAVSNYTTTEEFENANKAISGSLNDLNTRITAIEESPVDLTAYVSKSELNAAGYITAQDVSSMGYATTQYVTDQIANIPATDLSSYVSKEELNAAAYLQSDDLSEYATQSFVSQQIEAIPAPDLSSYATKSFVSEQIAAIPQPDLSSYITETELNDTLSSYAKVSDIEDNERVVSTALNSLADRIETVEGDYVSSDELDETLLSYATKNYVDNKIDELAPSDLNEYVSKQFLSQQAYLQADDISDVVRDSDLSNAGYVTTTELSSAGYVTTTELSNAGYITETDLANAGYVTTTELSNAGYVTTNDLSSAGYVTTTHLNTTLADYVTDSDLISAGYVTTTNLNTTLADYVTDSDLASAGYVTTTNLNTTLSSYAKVSDIEDNEQVISTALNTLSDRIGLIENDYVSDDDLENFATKNYVDNKIDELAPSDLNEYVSKEYLSQQAYLQADAISDVVRDSDLASAGYVTNNELSSAGYVTDTDLSSAGYVTTTDLANAGYVTTTNLNTTLTDYVTNNELSSAGYVTTTNLNTALTDYVTETELSSAGYVTTTNLNTTLTDYVTDSDLSSAGYVTTTNLNTTLTDYVTDSDLSSAGYVTNTALNTTLASYTTKADVPYKFVVLSYAEYTALATKDPNTFYCIPEE